MILTKQKEVKVNLGNYESATVIVKMEIDTIRDHDELVALIPGLVIGALDAKKIIDEHLDTWIAGDITKLAKINAPLKDGEESVIEHWGEQNNG